METVPYFLSTLVLFAIYFGVLLATTGASGNDGGAAAILGVAVIVFMVASVVIQVLRFKNIGRSGWNVLWTFVPVVNIYFYWMLMAVPEGYADHKVMDTAAKVITGRRTFSPDRVISELRNKRGQVSNASSLSRLQCRK